MEAVGREKEANVKKGQDIHSYLYIVSDLNKHVSFYFYQKKCDFLFCVLKIRLLMTTGKLWFSCQFTNLFQILLYQSNCLHTRLSVSHIPCGIFGEGLSLLWIPHSSEPPRDSQSWMCLALPSSSLAKGGKGTTASLNMFSRAATFSTRCF